jgi:hypothetical protein
MYTNSDWVDWRVAAYANFNADGDLVGLPNGMLSADAANYLGNGLEKTSKIGDFFTIAESPGVFMSYPELQFILAEAAFKGYIPGSAEDYYKAGIWGSYNQYDGIENGDGDTYIDVCKYSWNPPYSNPDWDADDMANHFYTTDHWGWDPANAMELIATQRWVATFDQGLQAWIEWRRTGYPVLIPAIEGQNGGKVPVRVFYPSDEYSRNKANVDAAIAAQGADDMNTRVWWDID